MDVLYIFMAGRLRVGAGCDRFNFDNRLDYKEKMMAKVVGIDLGTSTSAVAIVEDGMAKVIPNERGEKIIPSVVSFLEDGTRIVGTLAKRRMIMDPENTVYSAKRLIGRKFFSSEVKKAQAVCAYKIVEGPNQGVVIEIRGKQYSLAEISSFILMEMKRIAEDYLHEKVDRAVITVPAYFNDGQRQATKDAGTIAGLQVLRIINEPTAAALAYGFGKGLNQKIGIYDLGGGTFDISVLEIGDDIFEVISTAGDTFLGGDDFDDRLIDYLAEIFYKEHNVDLRTNKHALQRLKDAAERGKVDLSENLETDISITGIVEEMAGPLDLHAKVARNYFGKLVYDLIQKTFKVCDEAMQNAGMTVDQLDSIILVGGPTKMSIIKEAVESYFFKTPQSGINPEEVVALGASIQGSALMESSTSSLLLDVTPMSLGIATAGGLMDRLIARNTPIPTEQSRIYTTTRDNQESVNIRVFQGENRKYDENEPLGECRLTGVRPAKKGGPKIKVTFEINADGIVEVSAEDVDTGQEQRITLNVSGGLSREEIDKLKSQHASGEDVAERK